MRRHKTGTAASNRRRGFARRVLRLTSGTSKTSLARTLLLSLATLFNASCGGPSPAPKANDAPVGDYAQNLDRFFDEDALVLRTALEDLVALEQFRQYPGRSTKQEIVVWNTSNGSSGFVSPEQVSSELRDKQRVPPASSRNCRLETTRRFPWSASSSELRDSGWSRESPRRRKNVASTPSNGSTRTRAPTSDSGCRHTRPTVGRLWSASGSVRRPTGPAERLSWSSARAAGR